jgi:hypothetical protein
MSLLTGTCRLGIRGSFFCGQECFKAGCVYHSSHPDDSFAHPLLQGQVSDTSALLISHSCPFQKKHKIIHELAAKPISLKNSAAGDHSSSLA